MKHRILLIVFIATLLGGAFFPYLKPQTALAAAPPQGGTTAWSGIGVIHLTASFPFTNSHGQTFQVGFDNDFLDGFIWDSHYDYTFKQTVDKTTCTSTITPSGWGSSTASVELKFSDQFVQGACDTYSYTANNITNTGNVGNKMFNWTSPDTVTNIIGGETLGKQANGTFFVHETAHSYLGSGGACDETLTLTDQNHGSLKLDCPVGHNDFKGTFAVFIDGAPDAPIATTTPGSTGGSTTSPGITCSWSINPLNWLVCPILKGIQDIMNGVGNIINQYLTIPGKYFDTNDPTGAGKAVFTAWSSVRNIALAILGITALIMVISQALSFGPFDAYTVKKLLPRILVAAIMITLSWSLIQVMVAGSNVLGDSVRSIIYAPFSGFSGVNFNNNTIGLGLVGGLGAISFLGIFGVLSLGVTAALALLVGLAVIILRQMLVILLAILAPVALVLYILPGTDKAWKFWWDSFSGALLMYPIIVGFIAIGAVFSKVAALSAPGSNNATQSFDQLIAFVALYLPYFLLPAAIRLAGGAISTIGGVVNDRGRGAFDRLKNFRKGQAQQNTAKMRGYQRYRDTNRVGRGINTLLGAAANPRDASRGLAGIRAGRRVGRTTLGQANFESDPTLKANQNDDQFLLALADEGLAKQKIEDAKTRYDTAIASGDQEKADGALAEYNARRGALDTAHRVTSRHSGGTRLAALNRLAQTGYQFAPGMEGYEQLSDAVRSITGGDEGAYSTAMNEAQYFLKGAGRADLGGINHGAPKSTNAVKMGIRKLGNYQRGQGKTDMYVGGAQAWLGTSTVDSDGKTLGVPGMGQEIARNVADGKTTYEDVSQWHSMLLNDRQSATDANKLEIDKQVQAIELYSKGLNGASTPTDPDEFNRRTQFLDTLEANKLMSRGYGIDPSERDKIVNPTPGH